MSTALAGAPTLLRATLRHDGRRFAPWALIVTFLSVSSVIIYPFVFPTQADRAGLATAIGANPALGLIFGPAHDLTTVDGFNAWRSLALGCFVMGLGAITVVVRCTRAQEDSGQAELLASGVLGRGSRLLAGIGLGMLGSVVAGALAALLTVAFGGSWGPSLLLGAAFSAAGWLFTGVAAVAAQIGSDARTATSLAVGTLAVLFLLRGFSSALDMPAATLWANPYGWLQETRPAAGNHWWPLLLVVALALVLVIAAFVLQARRDFGQGLVAQRPGPATGRVRSVWALAVRTNRAQAITWIVAFSALGVVFGYFVGSARDLFAGDSGVQQILAAGATTSEELTGSFVHTVLLLLGIIAAIAGVQVVLRVRTEELADRVEPVLATPTSRPGLFARQVALAFLLAGVLLVVAGTLVAAIAAHSDVGVTFAQVLWQAVVTIPATWTVVALAALVVGVRPVASLAAWAGVLISFVLTLLGPTFGLDDWVLGISPFWHVPFVLLDNPDYSGPAWLALAVACFLGGGLAGFRRRDIAV